MLDKFWDKMGESLAGEWNARVFTLAFAFWGSGLVLYGMKYGWEAIQQLFVDFGKDFVLAGVLLIGALIIISASNAVTSWLTLPILKVLEGYWPDRIREWALSAELGRHGELKKQFNELVIRKREHPTLFTMSEERKLARLEYDLRYRFPSEESLLPTSIGNVLKSSEEYPWLNYGLETTITWPHLWLAMPDNVRQELVNARQRLDETVQLFLWCLLFCVWVIFAWWAPILGILAAVVVWFKVAGDAFTFGLLLRTSYDMYRFDLYKSLHWPLITQSDLDKEREEGIKLTHHLFRHDVNCTYAHPEK